MAVAEDIIREMFQNAVHVGHRTQKWNPKMKKFLYGEQTGVHIINLEKTAECLEKALLFMSKLISEGRTILFVSTKYYAHKEFVKLGEEIGVEISSGYEARIELREMIDGRRRFRGRIEGVTDGEIRLETKLPDHVEPQILGFAVETVAEARLIQTDELIRKSLKRGKQAGNLAKPDEAAAERGE